MVGKSISEEDTAELGMKGCERFCKEEKMGKGSGVEQYKHNKVKASGWELQECLARSSS